MAFVAIFSHMSYSLGRYSACVVYTKTIIHLSVGESGGYLPPLRGIIVNYFRSPNENRLITKASSSPGLFYAEAAHSTPLTYSALVSEKSEKYGTEISLKVL